MDMFERLTAARPAESWRPGSIDSVHYARVENSAALLLQGPLWVEAVTVSVNPALPVQRHHIRLSILGLAHNLRVLGVPADAEAVALYLCHRHVMDGRWTGTEWRFEFTRGCIPVDEASVSPRERAYCQRVVGFDALGEDALHIGVLDLFDLRVTADLRPLARDDGTADITIVMDGVLLTHTEDTLASSRRLLQMAVDTEVVVVSHPNVDGMAARELCVIGPLEVVRV